MEPATPPSRTPPAFKILQLLALAAFGCHGADSQASAAGARPLATAMTGASATGAKPDSALDCSAQHGSACTADERARAAATPPLADAGSTQVGKYGAPLGAAPTESLASVLAEPTRYAGQPLRVEGHVRRACTAMGCWMELAATGAGDAPACRVSMKDHAFFVPTNSAGSSARVEGTLAVRRIEPEQVAHMQSEGAA